MLRLNESFVAVRKLQPIDSYQQHTQAECIARFERVIQARWTLIEEAHSSISKPFLTTLTFWLMIIFLCFGIVAPRNALALVMIMLGAVSIASAVYVIVDLDTPLTGPIVSSSLPMRDALLNMTERVPLLDVRFFVTALLVQKETGGNLAEILDNLSRVIRDRFRIYREVRTKTAAGRLSAMILIALPPVMMILLSNLNPSYMRVLFDDPKGPTVLAIAGTLQLIGSAIIWKIIHIEV